MTWRDDALCAQVGGDAWYPDKGQDAARPKRVCQACPVRDACLDWAIRHREPHGVWGGLTPRQRQRLINA